MQPETQYYKTVRASDPPKKEGWYHIIAKRKLDGVVSNFTDRFDGSKWDTNNEFWEIIEWLEPAVIPDAAVLREALSELLNQYELLVKELCHKQHLNFEDVKQDLGGYQQAREALSQTGDGWVRVEDGLPDSGKSVLMYWKNSIGFGRISKGFYAAKFSVVDDNEENRDGYSEYNEDKDEYYYPEGWVEAGWEIEYSATINGVTHWQYAPKEPLPSPPQNI